MARTRVFEVDQAIEVAINVFWEYGYDKTSLTDLTEAMGITPPSFYYAFGSKDGLFKRALAHYMQTRLGYAEEALAQPAARPAFEMMLKRMADLFTDSSHPSGCLAANSKLTTNDISEETRAEIKALSDARRKRLIDRLQVAKDNGELSSDTDVKSLARYISVVGWGMAIAARSGSTKKDLYKTVEMAMNVWPQSKS